jgi:hypothetical protein
MSEAEDATAQTGQRRSRNARGPRKKPHNPDRDTPWWDFGKLVVRSVSFDLAPYSLLSDVSYLKVLDPTYIRTDVYVSPFDKKRGTHSSSGRRRSGSRLTSSRRSSRRSTTSSCKLTTARMLASRTSGVAYVAPAIQ